jgi:two-component system response regulator YesN
LNYFKKMTTHTSDRRKSVFVTLLVSYIVIFMLPILIGVALYTKVDQIMVHNADQANEAMLEQGTAPYIF